MIELSLLLDRTEDRALYLDSSYQWYLDWSGWVTLFTDLSMMDGLQVILFKLPLSTMI